ncbi:putative formate dehydrogenase-associated protein [Campylobacter blaseri]|uniref:Tat pathway signal protein n=1 Tax=Campylobacter blaseri TaxID=2042961 RepID=A0A2P8R460_9BACT|nr:twin-arginine translocation signal domain-containing protein [Campylobacter blaseri]PSM53265.1 Tat pathway signal protein [Campylobacter blaseri]PSM54731.1 Tat pathway signal protein [Campylobacter blaseri]QKF86786.1 putative formate dehydrogenase-associated protein [Campylobacter blaseri]
MKQKRRDFLKKSLKIGAVTGAAATLAMASDKVEPGSSGVVSGKAVKKEILYYKSRDWEKYYNVAW